MGNGPIHKTLYRSERLKEILKKVREENSSTARHTITTARDPNEKLVSPEGDILSGTRLSYTINYENEGEGIAYGVYITDTLEEDLDDSYSSLVVNNSGVYDPATHTITWFIGELQSKEKGSVSFSVNIKEDVPDKSEAINFATVYFPSVPETTRTNGTVNRIITATDNIAPITTATVSPSPNQMGWNNANVTIALISIDNPEDAGVEEIHYRLTGADTGESVVSGNTAQIFISSEGITNLSYWAIDNSGNIEPVKTLIVKIDKTPPIITPETSPQPNSYGWNNQDVTVTFVATDNLSGIAGVTNPVTMATEDASQYIGGEAVDLAGNTVSTSVTLNIDKTLPEILINVPKDLEIYLLNQTIFCDWSVQDLLSGIDSISATAPNQAPINLVSVGSKTFNVLAKDKAGNQKDLSVTYRIIYNFSGILPPIEDDGSSVFKLGNTIPIKFQLQDAQGDSITNAVAKLSIQKFSNNEPIGEPIEAVSTASSTIGNLFRYDASEDQYIFNLATKALSTGLWQLKIELDDGERYSVFVGLK